MAPSPAQPGGALGSLRTALPAPSVGGGAKRNRSRSSLRRGTCQGWKGARESRTRLKDQGVLRLSEMRKDDAKLMGSSTLASGKKLSQMQGGKNFTKPMVPATSPSVEVRE